MKTNESFKYFRRKDKICFLVLSHCIKSRWLPVDLRPGDDVIAPRQLLAVWPKSAWKGRQEGVTCYE